MPVYSFEGKTPRIHPTAFIAPTAVLVGDVTVEEGASVWYNAVLRGDVAPIVVGAGSNIQECAVLHGNPSRGVTVGAEVTVGHLAMIHGATLGDGCLVGNAAVVLDDCEVGAGALVAAGALLTPGTQVPDGMLTVGAPAKVRGSIAGTPAEELVKANAPAYRAMARRHGLGIADVADDMP